MNRRIYERPAEWNALRYPIREYHHDLFTDMLAEEYLEYTEAKTLPDKLDGLADIFFITIGALWKLKHDPYSYLYRNHAYVFDYPNVEMTREYYLNAMQSVVNKILEAHKDDIQTITIQLTYLLDSLNVEFAFLGCEEEEAELAISIICDSNDTKLVYNLKSHDKGDLKSKTFIPPTKRLKLLAESIQDGN